MVNDIFERFWIVFQYLMLYPDILIDIHNNSKELAQAALYPTIGLADKMRRGSVAFGRAVQQKAQPLSI